jgi:N-acyl-D-amino-acid deacylase
MLDVVIRNGLMVDGLGGKSRKADVGVRDGRIVEMGRVEDSADVVIDAKGRVVCPGFIDLHTHTDFTIVVNPRAESMVRQGVTTAVIGNCGHAPYPVVEERKKELEEIIFGFVPSVPITWSDLKGYFDRVTRQGVALNVAALMGLSTVRAAVMGLEQREADESDLRAMRRLVKEGMVQGAFGVSTGLEYLPGMYADTTELVELCKEAGRYKGAFHATHLRNRAEGFLQSTKEAIEICEESGIGTQISHHVPRFPSEGEGRRGLSLIDGARDRGLDVTCDTFPLAQMSVLRRYAWGSTTLSALLPTWAFEGGAKKLRKRLADPAERLKMRNSDRTQARLAAAGRWDRVMLEYAENSPERVGKTFAKISRDEGIDPWDAVFDTLLRERRFYIPMMASAAYSMESGRAVLAHPTSSVVSDGLALAPYGPLADLRFQVIQSYGYIPLLFQRFVREERLLTLEEAVRKCTSLPASRLGLKDRGVLKEGGWADIVVFDPVRITCKATFKEPRQFPEGIDYVFVNGQPVVERGEQGDTLSGRAILAR